MIAAPLAPAVAPPFPRAESAAADGAGGGDSFKERMDEARASQPADPQPTEDEAKSDAISSAKPSKPAPQAERKGSAEPGPAAAKTFDNSLPPPLADPSVAAPPSAAPLALPAAMPALAEDGAGPDRADLLAPDPAAVASALAMLSLLPPSAPPATAASPSPSGRAPELSPLASGPGPSAAALPSAPPAANPSLPSLAGASPAFALPSPSPAGEAPDGPAPPPIDLSSMAPAAAMLAPAASAPAAPTGAPVAAPESPVLSMRTPEDFADGASALAVRSLREGATQAVLKVSPEALGPVRADISMGLLPDGSQNLSMTLTLANAQALELAKEGLAALTQSLSAAGLPQAQIVLRLESSASAGDQGAGRSGAGQAGEGQSGHPGRQDSGRRHGGRADPAPEDAVHGGWRESSLFDRSA